MFITTKQQEVLERPLVTTRLNNNYSALLEKDFYYYRSNAKTLLEYKPPPIKLVLLTLLIVCVYLSLYTSAILLSLFLIPTAINLLFVNNNINKATLILELYELYLVAKEIDERRSIDVLYKVNFLRQNTTLFKPFIKNLLTNN
jgi:hypothetical protein